MSPVTEAQSVAQALSLSKTPAEKMAESLIGLTAIEEPESRSATLSLMIWAARSQGDEDQSDLLVRLEMAHGPQQLLRMLFKGQNVLELMQNQGPMDAGENLLNAAQETLYG